MGFTDGQHSDSDNTIPEKNVDYKKYGYPRDFRSKKEKLAFELRKQRKNKNYES